MSQASSQPKTKALQEVDLFNGGASTSGGGPRSPVKTNPFESYDRPVRLAKLNPEAAKFGPALPTKVGHDHLCWLSRASCYLCQGHESKGQIFTAIMNHHGEVA